MSILFQPGSKVDTLQSDFDTVTIQKNSAPDDRSFASVLAKKVSESVQSDADSADVAEIQQEVETGEYRIDPTRIAEHMLGYF